MFALNLLFISSLVSAAFAATVPTPNWVKGCTKRIQINEDFRNMKALNASLWNVENMYLSHLKFSDKGAEFHIEKATGSLTLGTKPTFSSAIFTIRMQAYAAPGFVSTAVIRPPAATMVGTDEIDVEITGNTPSVMQMVAWVPDKSATTPTAKYAKFASGNAVKMMNTDDLSKQMVTYTVSWDGNTITWYQGNNSVFSGTVQSPDSISLAKALKLGAWAVDNPNWAGVTNYTAFPDPYQTIESISIDGCLSNNWTASVASSSSIPVPSGGQINSTTIASYNATVSSSNSTAGTATDAGNNSSSNGAGTLAVMGAISIPLLISMFAL